MRAKLDTHITIQKSLGLSPHLPHPVGSFTSSQADLQVSFSLFFSSQFLCVLSIKIERKMCVFGVWGEKNGSQEKQQRITGKRQRTTTTEKLYNQKKMVLILKECTTYVFYLLINQKMYKKTTIYFSLSSQKHGLQSSYLSKLTEYGLVNWFSNRRHSLHG